MNEHDVVTDEEIDQMYDPQQQQQMATTMLPAQPMAVIDGVPVYPMSLAQVPALSPPQSAQSENIFTKKLGPLPVWGWGLGALVLGVGGFYIWQMQSKKVEKNSADGGDREDGHSTTALPSGDDGGWGPSRSRFAEALSKHFMRAGMADRVTVYDDADEAKAKGLKHVSPLLNIKAEGGYKVDKELAKLCKREGLNPIAHEDGSIGLYPVSSGKRGKAWEEYIDLLRDDGQKV